MSARHDLAAGVAIVAIAVLGLGGVMLSRIDRAAATARAAQVDAADVRRELAAVRAELAGLELAKIRADIERCRVRTESLRGVLTVLIPSGIWPQRVRLPDPPPGWRKWPEGNQHGYSTEGENADD